MPNNSKIPDFDKLIRELLRDAVVYAEVTGLNFFKESFEKQGWTDGAFYPWPDRNGGNEGRSVLIRTANLRDSLRVLSSSPLQIEFGTSEPYAAMHNEGGTMNITITKKARKYFWYMYKATGQAKWKAMALTKKTHLSIRMPKRQFIGESQTFMKDLDGWFTSQIQKRVKQL